MLDGTGKGVVDRIAGLGEGGLAGEIGSEGAVSIRIGQSTGIDVRGVHDTNNVVGQDMLQKKMEPVAVVLMAEVAELVQKDIVLKHARQAHDGEIQIDVSF